MQGRRDIVKSQKKFRHWKDENPIFLLETFDYNGKTHYVISSDTYLYIGYMEKAAFNQIINYKLQTHATSFTTFQGVLYFGMNDGTLLFISLEKAYNQIPFKKIDNPETAPILGIALADKGYGKCIYAFSSDFTLKLFTQVEEDFQLIKSVKIDSEIHKIVSKTSPSDQKLPCFMILPKTTAALPILLTIEELDLMLDKTTDFFNIQKLRDNFYLEDEKLFAKLTSMDFELGKMIGTIGYNDGSVEVFKIEKSTVQKPFYCLIKELRVQQRENIVSVSIISEPENPYIAYVSESNFSGFNYEKKSSPFAKVKVEKDKDITAIRWTRSKFFLAAPLSNDDKKRPPKVYCIEQDIAEEA